MDDIVSQLFLLDLKSPNYKQKYYILCDAAKKIPNSNLYKHIHKTEVPDSFLEAYFNTLKFEDFKDMLKFTKDSVRYVMNRYYEEGNIFDLDILYIHNHGYDSSILEDETYKKIIYDQTINYSDKQMRDRMISMFEEKDLIYCSISPSVSDINDDY